MSRPTTDEVIQFMSQYSLEDVLSGIIELQMLLYGHDDTFIPASEYLAVNALYACKEVGNKDFMWRDYEILEQYAKNACAPNIEELFSETIKMINASDEEKQVFLQSKMMQMKGNFYRGDGYIHQLVDHSFLQDDVSKMEEIESLIREIVKIEEEKGKKTRTYIDTYQKPSTFCKELLRECGLGSIEIIDTPGVSGNVEAARTAKSDIYLFLIKPDNNDESLTLKRIVTTIKADVATSKVAFLYKKEGFFITQKKYQDAKETVKKDMEAYSELFADLKGSIVSTELDVLDPAAHCILFPTMDPDDVTLPEELFLKDMKKKLVVAFSPNDDKKNDDEFAKLIKEYGEGANNLVLSIMSNIPTHDFLRGANAYTEEELSGEQHDRVMTKDNYRIRNDLDYVYNEEIKLLDTYFSSFVATEYPNEWEQKIIKYDCSTEGRP